MNERFAVAWRDKREFNHARSEWRSLVNQTFAGLIPEGVSGSLFDDIYRFFGTAAAWRVYDDVRPTLQNLRRLGFKLGIISNWDERLHPLLRELQLDEFFQVFVVSIEAGASKPNPKIFATATQMLGVTAAAFLHIGDTESEDVQGAKAVGGCGILLDRKTKSPKPGVITSLEELDDLLEKPLQES